MTTGAVSLRAAAPADCALVWTIHFAPDVRAVSGDPTVVDLSRHAAWYGRRIAAPDAPIWIVEADHAPVGVVRIDPVDDRAGKISIALGAEVRGRGIGRAAIAAACAAWSRPVVAEIQPTNLASRACFEACGFVPRSQTPDLVTYQWSP